MSGSNRWEPIHRLSSTVTLFVAFFGGAAMNAILKGFGDLFAAPNLPWWGDFSVAGLIAVAMYVFLRKGQRQQAEALASADKTHFNESVAIGEPKSNGNPIRQSPQI